MSYEIPGLQYHEIDYTVELSEDHTGPTCKRT